MKIFFLFQLFVSLNAFSQNEKFVFEPLSWEYVKPETKIWSEYIHNLYATDLFSTLDIADDITRFCPHYQNLQIEQKINVWGMIISGITRYESYYDPTARHVESSMGIDPITGSTIVSEGLLQLSYQDVLSAPYCRFDWSLDKNLQVKDPSKTIFSPEINLECGAKILAKQVFAKKKIVISKGAYWAVIKEDSPYQKIKNIENWVQRLSFCKP